MQSAIRAFCEALAPEHVVIFDAIEEQSRLELDYMEEAENLWEIRINLENSGFAPDQVVGGSKAAARSIDKAHACDGTSAGTQID